MRRLITLVMFVLLLAVAQQAAAQPVYDSFSACMASRQALNTSYTEDAAFCNYIQPTRVGPAVIAPYRGYDTSYYGYGLWWDDHCHSYLPRQAQNPDCVVGELKYNIMDSGLEKVTVSVDGNNMGMITKFSHRMTSGLRLGADHRYQITLELNTEGKTKTVVYYVNPMTMRMQDGAYWYPVYQDLFASAPYGQNVTPERDNIGGKAYIKKEGGG